MLLTTGVVALTDAGAQILWDEAKPRGLTPLVAEKKIRGK